MCCPENLSFKVMPEVGKGEEFGYNSPEFFQYDKYSYFDIEKSVVDGKKSTFASRGLLPGGARKPTRASCS